MASRHFIPDFLPNDPLIVTGFLAVALCGVPRAAFAGCTNDIDCDDGLPCTIDTCTFPPSGPVGAGTCEHQSVADGQSGGLPGCPPQFGLACGGCDDGLFCNGAETCLGGACVSGTPPCSGGEVCSESLKLCQPGPCSEGATEMLVEPLCCNCETNPGMLSASPGSAGERCDRVEEGVDR